MDTSLTGFRSAALEHLLSLLWRQWASLGVAGYSQTVESQVVDPEALLVLTATVGRHDSRLFDVVLDWLQINGQFMNAQRLRNLTRQADPEAQAVVSTMAAMLGSRSEVALKWKKLGSEFALEEKTPLFFLDPETPMPVGGDSDQTFFRHGLLRPPYVPRGGAGKFPEQGVPTLLLRLRALLGVNIRCEILCILGALPEVHPSHLARLIGHPSRTVQSALVEMAQSGTVQVQAKAKVKNYALVPGHMDGLLRQDGPTPWMNSVPLFSGLEKLWLGIADPANQNLETLTLCSVWRRLAKKVTPLLGEAGFGQPLHLESTLRGEDYCRIFVGDVLGFLQKV